MTTWVLPAIIDSAALVMNAEGWPEARPATTDLYFFGYGHEYKACLVDYCKVSGQAPMIPRWALADDRLEGYLASPADRARIKEGMLAFIDERFGASASLGSS